MRRTQTLRTEQGQSLVELAVILPMLLLLLLGVVDLGLGFRTYITLTNAAREGVRWVSIHPDDCPGAKVRIAAEAARVGLTYSVLAGDGGYSDDLPAECVYAAGDEAVVTVAHDYPLLFGAIPGVTHVPFNARATMVVLYDPVTP